MAWTKVPPENHPVFLGALPQDPRVETLKMFGGVAAKVNGHIFAGLFGLSTMVWLPEPERAEALALRGAAPFDPMGNGQVRSDKVMLPETMMGKPEELRRWIARAFEGVAALPAKTPGEEGSCRQTYRCEGWDEEARSALGASGTRPSWCRPHWNAQAMWDLRE